MPTACSTTWWLPPPKGALPLTYHFMGLKGPENKEGALQNSTQGSWAPQPPTSPSPAALGKSRWQSSPCLTIVGPGTQSSHHILMLMDPTKVWTFL